MKGRKKIIIWAVVLLVIALIGGMMLRPRDGIGYSQAQVTTGDISTTYSFTGSIVVPSVQTVTSGAPCKVKEIYVEANQTVEEGDRLLKLSTGETIRAQIDGEVVSLNAREGDMVSAGTVLAVVMDVSGMRAEISIDEYDVAAVQLGREVTVTVNALDVTSEGVLTGFDKQAHALGSMAAYRATVEFEVPPQALPGMQVEVKMLNESARGTLLLKVEALQFDENNQTYVLTRNADGEYVQTYVTTGINDGTNVQILSGLQNGQTVYYTGSFDLAMLMAMRGGR